MRGGTAGLPDAGANSSIHPGAADALRLTAPVAGTLRLPDRLLAERKEIEFPPSLVEAFLEMIGGRVADTGSLFLQNLQVFECGSPTCPLAGRSMRMVATVQSFVGSLCWSVEAR